MCWASKAIERTGLTKAVEQMPDGVVITDPHGTIQFVNPAFTDVSGYTGSDVIGENLRILEAGLLSGSFYDELWSTVQAGKVWYDEVINQRKDGTKYREALQAAPILGLNGEVSGCIVIRRDVTDQRTAEDLCQLLVSMEQSSEVGIVAYNRDGIIVTWNHAAEAILGFTASETVGKDVAAFVPADWKNEENATLPGILNANFVTQREGLGTRSDGSLARVNVARSTVRDAVGGTVHYIALVEDIDTRKEKEDQQATATKALETSEARYRTVFQTSLDCVIIIRLSDGALTDANQAFLHLTGFERQEVIGKASMEFGIWADPAVWLDLARVMGHSSMRRDLKTQIKTKRGDLIWVLTSASVIELEGVSSVVCVMKDISSAKAAEEEIRKLAFYDPLTHLPNRRLLFDRLEHTLEEGNQNSHCRALLQVDVDDFKMLNDTLGHQTGDLLLQEIAQRLAACLQDAGTVARLGSDEFVVLLDDLSEDAKVAAQQVQELAQSILDAVSQPYMLDGQEIRSTSSIGISVFSDRPNNIGEALKQVDIALSQAKAAGRNKIRFFAPALQAAVNSRAALETDLRKAISQEEFQLYYQPQVDRGHLIGAEALIRWKHPTRGLLLPAEFVPFAEERGLILPLGNWVLESACRQIAAWADRNQTAKIDIAVNISAKQFSQPDFVEQVLRAIDRTGADPNRLLLELTESALVEDIDDVTSKMKGLNRHGLRFSLDDFGTGYSSLSYLKRLPLDQLKIDRSFVHDILEDSCSGAIAQAIISLGRAMGLKVMAEGVETDEQRDFLSHLGCHSMQGYLFSHPLPVEDFENFPPNSRMAMSLASR